MKRHDMMDWQGPYKTMTLHDGLEMPGTFVCAALQQGQQRGDCARGAHCRPRRWVAVGPRQHAQLPGSKLLPLGGLAAGLAPRPRARHQQLHVACEEAGEVWTQLCGGF